MDDLAELLRGAGDATTFDLGRRRTVNGRTETSFASRPEEVISPEQFRDLHRRHSWPDEEFVSAGGARVVVPDDRLSQLSTYIRRKLVDYVDPSTDRIGHAFPVGSESLGRLTAHADGVMSFEWTSQVEAFARALVRGSAVLGSESTASLVSEWTRGQPVEYETRSILNGAGILSEPLNPVAGVRIESLPLATDQFRDYVPVTGGMSMSDYLGRMVLTIVHSAAPPLFRPQGESTVQASRATAVEGLDFAAVCEALSLEADAHLEPAFFWTDYGHLSAFCLTRSEGRWSVGRGHFKGRSFVNYSIGTDDIRGVTALELRDDHGLLVDEQKLGTTLAALAVKGSDKLRGAVSRWSRSLDSGARTEDQFIDLRIALESLYLKDFLNETTTQEMRFRLSIFGAWHLGTDFRERQGIRKRLRSAYDVASAAVHAGHIDHSPENRELLAEGQALCRRGIIRLINDGEPRDWGDLILGESADPDSASEFRPPAATGNSPNARESI